MPSPPVVPAPAPPTSAVPAAPRRAVAPAELQALLDGAGDVCVLPPGTLELPQHSRLVVPHSMRIVGRGTTLAVDGDAPPTEHLIDAGGLPDGSWLEVDGLRIDGPDTTGWAPSTHVPRAAIAWNWYRTWGSRLALRDVTVTGGYGHGVLRGGGGVLEVHDCDLSGWIAALAFFEDHDGWGALTLHDTVLRAPAWSKASSVGAYLHPHLAVDARRVTGIGWNRFAVYLNGGMAGRGTHHLEDVEAVDCSLVQTGVESATTLVRCAERGTPTNGGSLLRGTVESSGSRWEGSGVIGFIGDYDAARRFTGDVIRPGRVWLAASSQVGGTVEVDGCDVHLTGRSTLLQLTPGCRTRATVRSTRIGGDSTAWPLNVAGGSVRFVGTPVPARSRVVAPGVVEEV